MKKVVLLVCLSLLVFTSCEKDSPTGPTESNLSPDNLSLQFDVPFEKLDVSQEKLRLSDGPIKDVYVSSSQLSSINAELKDKGIAILKIEAMSENSPIILFDKQLNIVRLGSSWVANDPRRGGNTNITYNQFPGFQLANGVLPTAEIHDDAFDRWENEATCGGVNLIKQENPGIFNSAILSISGVTGDPFSDINILGHVPPFVFELVGLSENTLGVAFTFIFLDENGDPTDIDNDNLADTSLKEVWYNDGYTWTNDPANNPDDIDLASVITHEIGHTLEAGHFGSGIFNQKKGTIRYNPRAVMNALYFEPLSDLQKTDRASYCNTFSNW